MNDDSNFGEWYAVERERYLGLSGIVHYLVESLIKNAGIDYLSVTSRTKTVDSVLEKIQRKPYETPEKEITDFSGVRVITFIDSDVEKVGELIRTSFNVYAQQSLDKTDELGVDRFGYRSLHFVCDLREDRVELPEFSLFKGLVFEIQVRTALQHAWAEIEHDRNYKFSGTLPTPIKRRLNLLAGVLELVDREFVAIADDIDKYAIEISEKAQQGNLDVELNTASIAQYILQKITPKSPDLIQEHEDKEILSGAILELHDFGINSLADLNDLIDEEFIEAFEQSFQHTSDVGFLRVAMMYRDIEKYFNKAWKKRYTKIPQHIQQFLIEKYGSEKAEKIFKKNGITTRSNAGIHTISKK